jgi:succinate dehydrogenase / fumarate reductase cytochrome b subunit
MSNRGHAIDYRPHRLQALWRSTIGKKYVAAVTGLILALFVVAHMLGNLKAIEGPGHGNPALDRYAHFLRTIGSPVLPHDFALWVERIVVFLALVLHVIVVTQLYRRNRSARSGEIFHVLQFTTLTIHPTPLHQGTVYANAYGAFQRWWIVLIYVVAVILLGFHMNHALWSGAQTAGVDNPDRNWFWRRLASGVTVVTVIGFALVPTLFWTGALPKPGPTASRHLGARASR